MSLRDQLDPDFLQEMDELLHQMEEAVLLVEKNAGDQDAINLLFRVMHSIKGNAGMFSLDGITNFTHHLESELDIIRKAKSEVSRPLVDAILASRDIIPRLLDGEDCDSEIQKTLDTLTGKVTISLPLATEGSPKISKEKRQSYSILFAASPDFFESRGESLFSELREAGDATISLLTERILSPLDESFDPHRCYLQWSIQMTTALSKEELADMFLFYTNSSDQVTISTTSLDAVQQQPSRLGEILVERGVISEEHVEQALEMQKSIGEILVAQGSATTAEIHSALNEQNQRRATKPTHESKSTIRVEAVKLDRLVDLVGEMVTAQARLSSVARESDDPTIQEVSEIIEMLTVGLRDQTMSIRMVPLGSVLGGFNRLVRDLSRDLDKDIVFETEGEETELDKSVVERLKEPLMHIIRNSADHGIESRERRIEAGKPVQGTVTISAYHEGAQVVIKIEDDGGGLNLEIIRKRAVERGLISAETVLTSQQTAQLICLPGFSTAEKVTDVSGRGVGMDVVKQSIESLRGTLVIDTIPGKSTSMYLRLPVTLAIIDGLMVSLDGDSFIIPLISVEECVDLNHNEVNRIRGRDIINLRGEAVPFVRLRERLGRTTAEPIREQVVITNIDGRRTGVVVDSVIGSHQTVLKPLGVAFRRAKEFSGATILGDGSVALILDIQTMIN